LGFIKITSGINRCSNVNGILVLSLKKMQKWS